MGSQENTIALLIKELELAHRRIAELERVTKSAQHAEKSLQEYEDFFRIHFSLAHDVMLSYDDKHALKYISPNVERILGYKPEELIGRKFIDLLDILDPSDREDALEDAVHVLSGQTILYSIYRFTAKDGSMKFGEVSGVPLVREGKVIAVISVAREIMDHASVEKSRDKTLKDKGPRLNYRINPRIVLDTGGVVLDLNEEAAEILNKSKKELVGSSIFHHTPVNLIKQRKINFDRIRLSGRSDSFLEEYEGKIFYNTLVPLCDEKGKVSKIEFNIQELSGKRYTPT